MFGKMGDLFGKKKFLDVFEKYDIEFSNRVFTNGVFLIGDQDGLKESTLEKSLTYLIEKGYGVVYVSTGKNDYINKVESIVTKTRNTRRHHPVTSDMSSVNSLSLTQELQHAKVIGLNLSAFEEGDKKVVLERLNLQFKKLFHDLYTNFKLYPKKEGLRSVIIIDEFDIAEFKTFANMEFFQTMKDYDIGFVLCVKEEFFDTQNNTFKDHIKQLVRINHFEC